VKVVFRVIKNGGMNITMQDLDDGANDHPVSCVIRFNETFVNYIRHRHPVDVHLHRHQILHGDIHSSNFLIDTENNLHLIDLGMGYFEHERAVSHGGVPRYMPPERMPDDNLAFSEMKGDYVSEIFQIGVCLYFLFSGDYPFNGLLLQDLASSIKHDAPPPLTKTPLGETIPQPIADIISKSMEKDPSRRVPTCRRFLQAWSLPSATLNWPVHEVNTK